MKKCIITFVIALTLFMAALFLCAQIPKSALRENYGKSADVLCEKPVFFDIIDGVVGSRIDRYADSILLNISYHYDGSLESVMKSAYYHQETQNENENLRDAVKDDLSANQQYMRYWHGSSVFVRLFHLFGDIRLMYVVNGILLAIGIALLMVLLIKKHHMGIGVSLILALVMGSVWFTPFCLEYIWTVLIAVYMSVFVLWKSEGFLFGKSKTALGRGKFSRSETGGTAKGFYPVFLVSGMLAAYLDFLTTETLTLLLPLMLLIAVEKRDDMIRRNIFRGCAWAAGYVLTWLAKWMIAAIVLHENTLPYVLENVGERIGGDLGLSLPEYLGGAIWRNIKCLFPFEYGVVGIFVLVALVIFVSYWIFVYRKPGADRKYIIIMLILSAVPLLRFLVLHNHSYLHHFFTYRALIASVAGLGLIVCELTSSGRKSGNG